MMSLSKHNKTLTFTQGILRIEKLAICTVSDRVDEWIIREFIFQEWPFLSREMDGRTLLFIAGLHGKKDGTLALGVPCDSYETMIKQVN